MVDLGHKAALKDRLDTVRSQRDAALTLVGRQELERASYRLQGYGVGALIGFVLGGIVFGLFG